MRIVCRQKIAVVLAFTALSAMRTCPCAAEGDFISTYVDAHGGCHGFAPLMAFESGAQDGRTPFGKAAETWTDEDLRALKATMARCVTAPNGLDISQERQILARVAKTIESRRQSRQDLQRQKVAAQQLARERDAAARQQAQERADAEVARRKEQARRREEAAAFREVQSFVDHIMSDAELERAQQLKERVPSLAARIDDLLLAQGKLKKEAEDERKRAVEREEAAGRIAAEQARNALERKREQQEAEIAAELKREAFEKSIPTSCKDAIGGDRKLESSAAQTNFERAVALAEAGESKIACTSFVDYMSALDSVRRHFIQCTKDLDANLDDLAREAAERALSRATDIYAKQKALKQKIAEISCQ